MMVSTLPPLLVASVRYARCGAGLGGGRLNSGAVNTLSCAGVLGGAFGVEEGGGIGGHAAGGGAFVLGPGEPDGLRARALPVGLGVAV